MKDQINETYKLAKYIVQELKDAYCSCYELDCIYIITTKDRERYEIFDIKTYKNLYRSNQISAGNAYVYITHSSVDEYSPETSVTYFHPLIHDLYPLIYAYLSQYSDFQNITPAVGLKYFAHVTHFTDIKQIVVEITDFDTTITNIKMPFAIRNTLGDDLGDYSEYNESIDAYTIDDIANEIDSYGLFGGYGFTDALSILLVYYTYRDKPLPEYLEKLLESNHGINAKSLDKAVKSIINDYKRIFNPFRLIYNLNTNQFQVE